MSPICANPVHSQLPFREDGNALCSNLEDDEREDCWGGYPVQLLRAQSVSNSTELVVL